MPCKRVRPFQIHPFGLVLICLGCAIVALVQNKALAKGAEDQKNEEKNDDKKKDDKKKDDKKEDKAAAEEEPAEEDEAGDEDA